MRVSCAPCLSHRCDDGAKPPRHVLRPLHLVRLRVFSLVVRLTGSPVRSVALYVWYVVVVSAVVDHCQQNDRTCVTSRPRRLRLLGSVGHGQGSQLNERFRSISNSDPILVSSVFPVDPSPSGLFLRLCLLLPVPACRWAAPLTAHVRTYVFYSKGPNHRFPPSSDRHPHPHDGP